MPDDIACETGLLPPAKHESAPSSTQKVRHPTENYETMPQTTTPHLLPSSNPLRRRLELCSPFLLITLLALWSTPPPWRHLLPGLTQQPKHPLGPLNPTVAPQSPSLLLLTTYSTIYGLALIESSRLSNTEFWNLRFPFLFALLAIAFGPAVVTPLWFAGNYLCTDSTAIGTEFGMGRRVDGRYIRPILPVLVVGFVGVPWGVGGVGWGYWVAAIGVVEGVRWGYARGSYGKTGMEAENGERQRHGKELVTVKATVWGLVVVGVLAWVVWVWKVLVGGPVGQGSVELVVIFLAGMYWNLLAVLELKATRLFEDYSWAVLVGSAVLFLVVGGPGAAVALAWLFREEVLAEGDGSVATSDAGSDESKCGKV